MRAPPGTKLAVSASEPRLLSARPDTLPGQPHRLQIGTLDLLLFRIVGDSLQVRRTTVMFPWLLRRPLRTASLCLQLQLHVPLRRHIDPNAPPHRPGPALERLPATTRNFRRDGGAELALGHTFFSALVLEASASKAVGSRTLFRACTVFYARPTQT